MKTIHIILIFKLLFLQKVYCFDVSVLSNVVTSNTKKLFLLKYQAGPAVKPSSLTKDNLLNKLCKRTRSGSSCDSFISGSTSTQDLDIGEKIYRILLSKDKKDIVNMNIKIAGKDYKITDRLGSGYFGVGVAAIPKDGNGEEVVIKFLKAPTLKYGSTFEAEMNGLEKAGMLKAGDSNAQALVQEKINGRSLKEVLMDPKTDPNKIQKLKQEYMELGPRLAREKGLLHNDIAPRNAIVVNEESKF